MSSSTHLRQGLVLQLEPFDDSGPLEIEVLSSEHVDIGASAVILPGEVKETQQRVALKVFPALLSTVDRQLLQRELLAVRRSRHHRILGFLGTCAFGPQSMLVSPLMANGNLITYLQRNPDADRMRLMSHVAEGVEFLHDEVKIVHGDLKCENVLVSDSGEALITDLGLSTMVEKTANEAVTSSAIRIRATLRFAAPELLDDSLCGNTFLRSKTPASDVYAFGMLLLQAFTGTHPWRGCNDITVLMNVVRGQLPPHPGDVAVRNGFVPTDWDLCTDCWKFSPQERPRISVVRSRLATRASMNSPPPSSRGAWSLSKEELQQLLSDVSSAQNLEDQGFHEVSQWEAPPSESVGLWIRSDVIGQGTRARVYLGIFRDTGDIVAVKQVENYPAVGQSKSDLALKRLEALRKEIDLLHSLDHPRIVHYRGFESTRLTLSMFLEYMPDGSIGDLLRKVGRFDEEIAKSCLRDVLDALEYLHLRGIWHRNINPGNILVNARTGVFKLAAFGSSKQTEILDGEQPDRSATAMFGSVFYMAPEVLAPQADGYSAKIDIWSLGCTHVAMMTGDRPWQHDNYVAVIYKLTQSREAPPIPPAMSLQSRDFLEMCFDPDGRIRPTAATLRLHEYVFPRPGWTFTGRFTPMQWA